MLNAGRKYLGLNSLSGKVFLTSGLGGMSGAQAKASSSILCTREPILKSNFFYDNDKDDVVSEALIVKKAFAICKMAAAPRSLYSIL